MKLLIYMLSWSCPNGGEWTSEVRRSEYRADGKPALTLKHLDAGGGFKITEIDGNDLHVYWLSSSCLVTEQTRPKEVAK